ncbi:MAG: sodium:glutamate symporter, partial [Oscillospiraceae bacterium]|nr:sodium:glutamate symporter [Oscillospiraceae bacterium]
MTVSSLFNDMVIIALFMLAGFFVREVVKPIQKLFLPSSLIGGLLALILGPQLLNLVEVPSSFSSFSNVLIAPIMAALLFGVTINRKKIVGYLDYICVEQAIYGMQMCVGAGLGAALALLWPGLPLGWGSMGVFAFQGGHGNAGAAGQTYTDLGIPENMSIGMVLATFGLIVAMLIG